MNHKNIFLIIALLTTTICLAQSEITDGQGQPVSVANISVTAEPTNITVIDDNCPYVQGELLNYLNCIVENNQVPDADYHLHLDKGDYLNGVSTLDLVMIMRHISKVEMFDDAHQIVAADVNGDNKVNVKDLLEIRRLILGIDAAFADSNSWRFFKSGSLNVTGIGPQTDLKFGGPENFPLSSVQVTAVKVGDVNYSAVQ